MCLLHGKLADGVMLTVRQSFYASTAPATPAGGNLCLQLIVWSHLKHVNTGKQLLMCTWEHI